MAYINYLLMRYVFHCTPSELRRQDIRDIQDVLACVEVEANVKEWKKTVRNNTPKL